MGHQTQLTYLERSDRSRAWITLVFLAAVALLPFTIRVVGEFIAFRTARWPYWFNILLLGLLALRHCNDASRAQLMKPDVTPALIRTLRRRVLSAQLNDAVAPRVAVLFKL